MVNHTVGRWHHYREGCGRQFKQNCTVSIHVSSITFHSSDLKYMSNLKLIILFQKYETSSVKDDAILIVKDSVISRSKTVLKHLGFIRWYMERIITFSYCLLYHLIFIVTFYLLSLQILFRYVDWKVICIRVEYRHYFPTRQFSF